MVGWVLLSAAGGNEAGQVIVESENSSVTLDVINDTVGNSGVLTRFPEAGTTIRLAPESANADSRMMAIEIGWLQAYAKLSAASLRRLTLNSGRRHRTFAIAFNLLCRGEWTEIRRRLLRRGEGLDATAIRHNHPQPVSRPAQRRKISSGGPIRAVMCGHDLSRDGAPLSQFELTRELTRQQVIQPVVVSPRDGPLRRAYELAEMQVVIRDSGLDDCLNAGDYDLAIDGFAEFLDSFSPDMIYANTARSFFAIEAADRLSLPCIWNLRESESAQRRFEDYPMDVRRRARDCLQRADGIIFVAHATREAWGYRADEPGVTVIHNALDPTRFDRPKSHWSRQSARQSLNIPAGDISLLCVGTLCERKGQMDLIRSAALLPPSVAARLWIDLVGGRDVDYERAVLREIKTLAPELRHRIRFHDETDDIGRHYIAADIFACTSRYESYPRVVLEAMAFELAIIAAPVFGIREQLEDTVSASFYTPGNIQALADRLVEMASDETLRRRLGENALRDFQQRSDFTRMARQYADAFRQACYEGGPK